MKGEVILLRHRVTRMYFAGYTRVRRNNYETKKARWTEDPANAHIIARLCDLKRYIGALGPRVEVVRHGVQ